MQALGWQCSVQVLEFLYFTCYIAAFIFAWHMNLIWTTIVFPSLKKIQKFQSKHTPDDNQTDIAGLFMALQPRIIACGTKRATMGMVIRFLCGPVIMSTASITMGLRGAKLHAAIVQVTRLNVFYYMVDELWLSFD